MRYKNKPSHTSALTALVMLGVLASGPGNAWADYSFSDPLSMPAISQSNFQHLPLMAITQSGKRIIAVGMRGIIIYSDNQGANWQQAAVPVQSDLIAIHFSNANTGWVTGHNGVILHTTDAGASWTKQLDGRMALEPFSRFYIEQADAGFSQMQAYADLINMNFASGPALPLLSLWFDNSQRGYAVGAFGTLLHTNDGGQNWLPALHLIDNPEALHLNAIKRVDGHLYIASERGTVFHLDEERQRFVPLNTGYTGGLFGLEGGADYLLVYGLGGQIFASDDQGQHWQPLANPSSASLTGSTYNAKERRFTLSNNAGQLLSWQAGDTSLQLLQSTNDILTDVSATANDELMVTGLHGFKHLSSPSLTSSLGK